MGERAGFEGFGACVLREIRSFEWGIWEEGGREDGDVARVAVFV